MTLNASHWDSQTKQRLFGLGVEAYIMSMQGRYSDGGPFFNVKDNWINNIDIEYPTYEEWANENNTLPELQTEE